jgi:hypothetical protein
MPPKSKKTDKAKSKQHLTPKKPSSNKRASKGTKADPKKLLELTNSHLFCVTDPADLEDANDNALTQQQKDVPFPKVELKDLKEGDQVYITWPTDQEDTAFLCQVTNIGPDTNKKNVLTVTYYNYPHRDKNITIFDHFFTEDKSDEDLSFYLVHRFKLSIPKPAPLSQPAPPPDNIKELRDDIMSTMNKELKQLQHYMETIAKDLKASIKDSQFRADVSNNQLQQKQQNDERTRKMRSLYAQYDHEAEERNQQGYYREVNAWAQPAAKSHAPKQHPAYPTTITQNTQAVIKNVPYHKEETNISLRKIVGLILDKKNLSPLNTPGMLEHDKIHPTEYTVKRALKEGALPQPNRQPPVIIVTFKTREAKNKFVSNNGEYIKINQSQVIENGDKSKDIYISENLTKYQNALFYKARQVKKDMEWQFCWTKNGAVYLKKSEDTESVRIDNEQDLDWIQDKENNSQPSNRA